MYGKVWFSAFTKKKTLFGVHVLNSQNKSQAEDCATVLVTSDTNDCLYFLLLVISILI